MLVGKVADTAGLYAPIAFLIAALLAGLTGLSYAELAARHPKSAGEAVYVEDGLRWRPLSILVGFLIILTGIVSAATIANGFVGYLHVFVAVPDWLAITLLVFLLGGLAAWGIDESVMAATFITLVEVGGLLLILAVAGGSLAELPARLPELIPPPDGIVWQGILLGAFLAFYAFIGFEDMVNVAEEVKEPTRNLPLAILIAIGVSTLLYLLVALVAVLALPPAELAQSRAPLALIWGTFHRLVAGGHQPHQPVRGGQRRAHSDRDGGARVLRHEPRGLVARRLREGALAHAHAVAVHGAGDGAGAGSRAVVADRDAGQGHELHYSGGVRVHQPRARAHQAPRAAS